jgi:hypothetical protein
VAGLVCFEHKSYSVDAGPAGSYNACMKHADFAIDILDAEGVVVGQKPRRAVDKWRDIFNGVHVVLITPRRELAVSLIPQREELPNRYAGMLGTTLATIRRHAETAEAAARRGLKHELLIERPQLQLLRDGMVTLEDDSRNWLTAYLMTAEQPLLYRLLDIGELMLITPEGLEVAMTMHGSQFAPTLKAIWPSLRATVGEARR